MKYIFTLLALIVTLKIAAQRCVTPDYLLKNSVSKFVKSAKIYSVPGERDTLPNEVIIIPVVVHVLYNNSTENISDQQILSQIKSLNEDFRRQNADAVNTPDPFKSVAADSRIVFCLAKVDPDGKYTTGIIRKFTSEKTFLADDAMKFASKGGDNAWDATKYLNLWVCNLFGRTLGYSVLPGSPLEKDGVVLKYNVFGTTGILDKKYNKGRTATHEIGHWLGLRHLWGDAACGDDGVADTPPQETSNSNCTTFPHVSSCSINQYGDMFMNFMDFNDDACMNLFTNGQKSAMRTLFAKGNSKNSFLNSMVCDSTNAEGGPLPTDQTGQANNLTVSIYPNPFINEVIVSSSNFTEANRATLKIYNATGKLYTSQILRQQKTSIPVNNLPAGIYFVRIESNGHHTVQKIIKLSQGK